MPGRARRRAWVLLVRWYAVAMVPPVILLLTLDDDPSCTVANDCITGVPSGRQLFPTAVLFLLASSVIAVPLCAYLVRLWELPATAATVAALTAWFVTPMLLCGSVALLSG